MMTPFVKVRHLNKACRGPIFWLSSDTDLLCLSVGGSCVHEEDGNVMVRDDLDALLQVCSMLVLPSCKSAVLFLVWRIVLLLREVAEILRVPLFKVLPPDIRGPLVSHENRPSLLEVSCTFQAFYRLQRIRWTLGLCQVLEVESFTRLGA